jgi:hypothetical protein
MSKKKRENEGGRGRRREEEEENKREHPRAKADFAIVSNQPTEHERIDVLRCPLGPCIFKIHPLHPEHQFDEPVPLGPCIFKIPRSIPSTNLASLYWQKLALPNEISLFFS